MFFIFSLLLTIGVLYVVAYFFATRKFNYWKKRNVPFLEPTPFFGNFSDTMLFKLSFGEVIKKIYDQTKLPYIGIFRCDEPSIVIRDVNLIKSILVKDFDHFIDRTMTDNKEDDPMGSHILFVIKNPDWREIRRKITPVFTSGKMKLMHKLIVESGDDLTKYLTKAVDKDAVIETRELCSKYTTDAITSTSFGIKANCFVNEDAEFRVVSRRILNWNSFSRGVSMTCYFLAPLLVKLFHLKFIDTCSANFLRQAFWQTMQERERTKFVRNDLLDILIQMKKEEKIDDPYKLEGDKLVAQATQFFLAGYETSSSTISFTLYELAKNKDVQDKLRQEVKAIHQKYGSINYDALNEMNYLDMCIKETLRKYPVLPFLDRRCSKDYKIPGTDDIIEKGVPVYISNMGLHYDPEYYPNPEEYIPERFTEENMNKRPVFAYLPFGEGPRNCIGARFGLLSSKSGLSSIIKDFEVDLCRETQKTMLFDPKGFLLAPIKGLKLKFTKL